MSRVFSHLKRAAERRQGFWNLAGRLASWYPDRQFRRLPREIILEPTNVCNLKCPVCPTTFAMGRTRGFMETALFESVIDEFKDLHHKPVISMNFAGEPTLNKNVSHFIEYASRHGHKTYISTNATVLKPDLCEAMIEAGLGEIHLCIDGGSKASHEAYRFGSRFEVVQRNIEDFIKVKRKLGRANPKVTIQTLLTSFSETEVDQLVAWAREIGSDSINLKTLSMGSYTTDEMKQTYGYLVPTKTEFQRKTTTIHRTLCSLPVNRSVVYWNGDLGLCCVDFSNAAKMPNIKERGFIQTYFSDEVVKMRRAGFQMQHSICQGCSLGQADFMGLAVDFPEGDPHA